MVNQQAGRTTLPDSSATNLEELRLRDISFGATMIFEQPLRTHYLGFEVEFSFVTCKGKSLEPFRRVA